MLIRIYFNRTKFISIFLKCLVLYNYKENLFFLFLLFFSCSPQNREKDKSETGNNITNKKTDLNSNSDSVKFLTFEKNSTDTLITENNLFYQDQIFEFSSFDTINKNFDITELPYFYRAKGWL